jgi:hypothetical protein
MPPAAALSVLGDPEAAQVEVVRGRQIRAKPKNLINAVTGMPG